MRLETGERRTALKTTASMTGQWASEPSGQMKAKLNCLLKGARATEPLVGVVIVAVIVCNLIASSRIARRVRMHLLHRLAALFERPLPLWLQCSVSDWRLIGKKINIYMRRSWGSTNTSASRQQVFRLLLLHSRRLVNVVAICIRRLTRSCWLS